ncbi:MAG: hypothetical protein JF607_19660 [Burkholderiales bacterium]|jgi:hypothetical protein|nr:hypothetical protein [Burkholderiales bacterium]
MTLISIILGLIALTAAIALWLLSTASHDRISQLFPEYARRIYRTPPTALRESPVRLLALLFTPLPAGADSAVMLLRSLAFTVAASAATAILAWSFH